MKHGFWVLILAISFCTHLHATSCDRLNYQWKHRFVKDFGVRDFKGAFRCGRDSIGEKLAQAFEDVFRPPFLVNADGYSPNFYAFAKKKTRKTVFEFDHEKCGAVATMTAFGKMTICSRFLYISRESAASAIIHEAAHARWNDTGHVVCTHGAHKGEKACDPVFHADFKGSGYNFGFMYLWWVTKGSTYRGLDRSVARHLMRYFVYNNFNKVPKERLKAWLGK